MINKTKKILVGAILASSFTTLLSADTLGVEAGYAIWSPKLTGNIKKDGDSIDLENDLGYGSTKINSFVWGYLDHPVPVLPNIKIQYTSYSDSASGMLKKTFTYAGKSFSANTYATSEITLNQLDVIPYWRILDNWVNFDIGLNIKNIDGNLKIDTITPPRHVDEDFKVTVPMLYAKARFDMPFTGLSVESDISYISYSGNKLTDFKAGVVYQYKVIGATLGYRKENLTLDDIDDTYGDINIAGVYAGVFLHF